MSDTPLPARHARERLHVPPSWVSADAVFFITINCRPRGVRQLTVGDIPARLFASVAHYRETGIWWPEIVLLMPDHLHALIAFNWRENDSMNAAIRNWKRYTARTFCIVWQRDYFDHRIRNYEDHADKWNYIRENPVRAGLLDDPEAWPHVWFPDRIGWGRD